jgi:hypothetical protein
MARIKPSNGQLNLIGEIYNYNLKYVPHIAVSSTGEKVVVLRLPKEATDIERVTSHGEARRLSGDVVTSPTKDYWRNKARDDYRRKMLQQIN